MRGWTGTDVMVNSPPPCRGKIPAVNCWWEQRRVYSGDDENGGGLAPAKGAAGRKFPKNARLS